LAIPDDLNIDVIDDHPAALVGYSQWQATIGPPFGAVIDPGALAGAGITTG